jgi:hypothetical protein
MWKKILLGVLVLLLGFLGFAASRPDTYRVERSATIEAPAVAVFEQIDDLRAWPAWSPWDKLDPGMEKAYSGPPRGVGSSYSWKGNEKVGEGKLAITESEAPTRVACRLEFIKPFSSVAQTEFRLVPAGTFTTVTWSMQGQNNLMGKVFGLFMDMDSAIGADFEKGLASLKQVAEASLR